MAAIFGFLAGLFLAISLLAFGIIPLESFLVTLLPVVGLVIPFALAMWAPIGAGGVPETVPAAAPVADASEPAGTDTNNVE
jgi:hypothetical protein